MDFYYEDINRHEKGRREKNYKETKRESEDDLKEA